MSPLDNPLGFSGADCIEILVAALLLACALGWRPFLEPHARRFATCAGWSMLLLAALPVVLRLAAAAAPSRRPRRTSTTNSATCWWPIRCGTSAWPIRRIPCTGSSRPSSSCRSPLTAPSTRSGQGLALALGWTIFGTPWAGVVLAIAAFCALCYWMLRGWTTPGWALAGGLLAVIEFGPLNQWMNSYWGGAVAAAAGCLVFGALPRLAPAAAGATPCCWASGLGIHLLTRPYESIFLVLACGPLLPPGAARIARAARLARACRAWWRSWSLPAMALTLCAEPRRSPGSWTTLPEIAQPIPVRRARGASPSSRIRSPTAT